MYIENLTVKNFRNYKYQELSFNKKFNYIIGKNAQGKTNIIESIYFSSFLKSFRTNKIQNLIKEDENKLKINLNIFNNKVEDKIEINLTKDTKILKFNEKVIKKYNYISTIIFHPEEINYINSYPVYRRNLIDRSIFFNNKNYITIYRNYLKCLKQRNILLKQKSLDNDHWQDQLVNYGSKIIKERITYLDKINNFLEKDTSEKYSLKYSKNYNINEIESDLKDDFLRKKDRELHLGYTLAGPHKDDIIFNLNDRPADVFASQGQKRSMIISYKTAQILDYKAVQGHYPLLILDDMTSELDINRKNILLENILENSGQVFITSTDFKQTNYSEKCKVFKVDNGVISTAD